MSAILGLSAFYHDSAAALVRDGTVLAAAQEERFSRRKYDARFPAHAVRACLEQAGLTVPDLDFVAYYEQPLTKFERLIETYLDYAPAGFASFSQAIPVWLRQKLHIRKAIKTGLDGEFRGRMFFPGHHESHAASAFFPSPFDEAAIVTLDGVGEWATTTVGRGQGNHIEIFDEIRFPHSLGLLYSAFTYYCGFKVNSGEYKLMGLAPYGRPRFAETILENLIDLRADGSYSLDLSHFEYCEGLRMTGPRFDALFGGPARQPESRIDQRHMDLAASVQRVCEEVMLRTARHAWERSGRPPNLVMAGGVALNCVGNGRILREGPFQHIWIQPASGDAGGALGAALFAHHQILGKPRVPQMPDSQSASWLGPAYSTERIEADLNCLGAHWERLESEPDLLATVAAELDHGRIVGWFQGRSEYGPRALGARSILADPRRPQTQAELNLKIKFREGFRPFAPVVLRDHAADFFDVRPAEDSAYMLMVAPVRAEKRTTLSEADAHTLADSPDLAARVNVVRSTIPAVTHVDYSARLQTIDARHGRFQRLLQAFHARTGCPILVNTSFNLSWEPIVETPAEAYHTFMQSAMDVLVLEHCVLRKSDQPLGLCLAREADQHVDREALPWGNPDDGQPVPLLATSQPGPGVQARNNGLFAFVPAGDVAAQCAPVVQERERSPVTAGPRMLLEDSRRDPRWRLLGDQLPYAARIVELGCGGCALAAFLSVAHRTVLAVEDQPGLVRGILNLGRAASLQRLGIAVMNPVLPALQGGFFDVVLIQGSNQLGRDQWALVETAARLLAPGGHLIVLGEGRGPAALDRVHPTIRLIDRAGLALKQVLPDATGEPPDWESVQLFAEQPRLTGLERRLAALLHGRRFLAVAQRPFASGESP